MANNIYPMAVEKPSSAPPDNSRPDPLVDSDVDLSRYPFIKLDVAWLRDSEFAVLTSGDEFKAGLNLRAAAWHQVPAASLPDDDRMLARYAGVTLHQWTAIKNNALTGFILCSDGRLYCRDLAPAALDAWATSRKRSEAAREKWKRHPNRRDAANANASPANANASAHAANALHREGEGEGEGEGNRESIPLATLGECEGEFQKEDLDDDIPPILLRKSARLAGFRLLKEYAAAA